MDIARADFIEGMAKGMAVLESFDTERQRLNATLASQRAGITRAAARRHLLTLAHLGYLETDGSWFWLSPKVLRFSGSYLASARLPRIVQPMLDRLAARTGEAFSVVVLDGDQVVIVARSGPTRLLAYGLHLGARLPAHATSTGRVLLASRPRAEFNAWLRGRALPRLTALTTVEPKKLKLLVQQVREQDWCAASEEHEVGVHAVAVPLRNMAGQVLAALNVVTARERLQPPVLQRDLLPVLQEAAREARPLL
ncbi:MAG TPA: IclR family transcriptional regulator C-terminal domain-containing protein [Ramlibacter sp.]|jgi:IclR family pca regulon transcriptional regulator|uniref:IclR family transcriptional regulator domain-containing protein n=1 Tax=Ramlibacter sp. TaxID=1917967 RepID=UPI002D2A2E86|nr:IclR family transcriptional regulator C-terminal domain-containing protein [Ramlibacter sp.]HZY18418.1 IclR family transcriptional regulator C-terminal domain-containing protein [Ramlibacter sp.]